MLEPFERLWAAEVEPEAGLPLPPLLQKLYGNLAFPWPAGRPYVVDNPDTGRIRAADVLAAIAKQLDRPAPLVLLEGGPHVMGDFFAEELLDELFLTLAPQVAGRAGQAPERPGLVAGRLLAPDQPAWSTLTSVLRAGDHLFLRYRFPRSAQP
jgi:riboflavin biosynthesis pyrimidine reductase